MTLYFYIYPKIGVAVDICIYGDEHVFDISFHTSFGGQSLTYILPHKSHCIYLFGFGWEWKSSVKFETLCLHGLTVVPDAAGVVEPPIPGFTLKNGVGGGVNIIGC